MSVAVFGSINMDVIAYDKDNDGAIHIIDCNENTSANVTKLLTKSIQELKLDLTIEPACTNRSDHASFWRYNIPAIVVSQNFFKGEPNPCYHKKCDQADLVNYPYVGKILTMILHSLSNIQF